ncbi:hypothetical protein PRNP1_006861 [Phytophthora ramorum]
MSGWDVGKTFTAALARNGTALTSKDLVEQYPSLSISTADSRIELDKCKFVDLFDTDPVQAREAMTRKREEVEEHFGVQYLQQILRSNRHHPLKKNRRYDCRLEPDEKAKLAGNGIVVSDRMQSKSFGDVYYQLYSDDLPVFVTADSILHAWHRSFDAFLVEIETACLAPTLHEILDAALSECEEMATHTSKYQSSTNKSVADVRNYLVVGLSLLQGELLDESERLRALWAAIHAERTVKIEMFSAPRTIDFSQFQPRGHHTKSEHLKKYFRAMMWLGMVDLRIAGGEIEESDLHQLVSAVILVHCLQESDTVDSVTKVDALISSLVADSGLGAASLSVNELACFVSAETTTLILEMPGAEAAGDEGPGNLLLDLQQQVVRKSRSSGIASNLSSGAATTSFALFGQRFVWSAFIFSRLVYDEAVHDGVKQTRRIPSAVDVAFTLFGNNEAAQVLRGRMEAQVPVDKNATSDAPEFVPHRDGIPFGSNLVALRQMIDDEFDNHDERDKDSGTASISTL